MAVKWVSDALAATVTVCEEFGTRKETFGATAFEAEVTLRCAWANRFKVVYDIYYRNVSYADAPDCLFASASILPTKARGEDLIESDPVDVIKYSEALITVKYSTAEIDAKKLRVETLEPAIEFMVLPYTQFQWGQAADTDDRALQPREAPGRQVVMWKYAIQWLQQDVVPPEFWSAAGKVNYQSYTSPAWNRDFATQTMMYTPGPIKRSWTYKPFNVNPGADVKPKPGWDYLCNYKVNPFTWNRYYRADKVLGAGLPDTDRFVTIYRKTPEEVYEGYPMMTAGEQTKLLPLASDPAITI